MRTRVAVGAPQVQATLLNGKTHGWKARMKAHLRFYKRIEDK